MESEDFFDDELDESDLAEVLLDDESDFFDDESDDELLDDELDEESDGDVLEDLPRESFL